MSILIADDHPFTLQGTKNFVESLGYRVANICSSGITAFNLITAHVPEIAIVDVDMPGMDGLEVLEKVFSLKIRTKVILLTMHREMAIYKKANEFGVYGYLLKNMAAEELSLCLKEVLGNKRYISHHILCELVQVHGEEDRTGIQKLSFSEKKVLEMIAEQRTSKQIGELLFISEKTVEGHQRNIIEKLGLPKEKNTLLIWAMKHMDKKQTG